MRKCEFFYRDIYVLGIVAIFLSLLLIKILFAVEPIRGDDPPIQYTVGHCMFAVVTLMQLVKCFPEMLPVSTG